MREGRTGPRWLHRIVRQSLTEVCNAWLQIGWPGGAQLSDTEQRAHFALWAILKSPLIFGNDLG